jgi:prephenate dehydrogenase
MRRSLAIMKTSGADSLSMSHFFSHAVILGDGAVGGMLSWMLLENDCQVTTFDLRSGTDVRQRPAGEYARALRDADLVILSLPEQVCLTALQYITAMAAPHALVVDTTSVKSDLPPVWANPERPPMLSINPMFAPGLAIAGRPCLVVDPDHSAVGSLFRQGLSHWGLKVVPIPSAEAHDRLCAATQASVHAVMLVVGLAFSSSGVPIQEVLAVAPPPCQTVLMLLARITSGAPEVYEDIQVANPFASAARESLRTALSQLEASLSSTTDFGIVLQRVTAWLGGEQEPLARQCGELFTDLIVGIDELQRKSAAKRPR